MYVPLPRGKMPCCEDGKPCGGPAYHVSPDDAVYAAAQSRYPKVLPRAHSWKAAENGAPQFEDYDDGLRRRADDEDDDGAGEPFEYSGEHLAACNFPLGCFHETSERHGRKSSRN